MTSRSQVQHPIVMSPSQLFIVNSQKCWLTIWSFSCHISWSVK